MRQRILTLALAGLLVSPAIVSKPDGAVAAPVQGGSVRIVGPRGEPTPVVNENNTLQLRVEGAGSVSRWTSDSTDVATVSNTGVLSGRRYGFATIIAETNAGTVQVIAVGGARRRGVRQGRRGTQRPTQAGTYTCRARCST